MNFIAIRPLRFIPIWLVSNWLILQLLTHFYPSLSYIGFASIFVVVNVSAFLVTKLQYTLFSRISMKWMHLSLGVFFTAVVLLMLGSQTSFDKPYILFAHLGAGTLFGDKGVSLFGDLAHLTSAAKCNLPVQVGENLCDIWQRSFNQNPQVVNVFRLLSFTNVFLVGIFSTILLLVLLYWASWKFQIQSLAWFLFLISPPFVLALDRGNEVITMLLIMSSIFVLRINDNLIWLALVMLSAASFFKFWPLLLLIFLTIFSDRYRKFFLATSIFMASYWILHLNTLKEISRSTMKGSLDGLSFGLKILGHSQYSDLVRIQILSVMILLSVLMLKWFTGRDYMQLRQALQENDNYPYFVSILLAYVGLWAFTDSYIYRLIIFLPVIVFLLNSEVAELPASRKFLSVLLIVFFTSRSQVAWGFSSAFSILIFTRVLQDLFRSKYSKVNIN